MFDTRIELAAAASSPSASSPTASSPTALRSDELLTAITAAQRTINQATARQLPYVAEFARRQLYPCVEHVFEYTGGSDTFRGRPQAGTARSSEPREVLAHSRYASCGCGYGLTVRRSYEAV